MSSSNSVAFAISPLGGHGGFRPEDIAVEYNDLGRFLDSFSAPASSLRADLRNEVRGWLGRLLEAVKNLYDLRREKVDRARIIQQAILTKLENILRQQECFEVYGDYNLVPSLAEVERDLYAEMASGENCNYAAGVLDNIVKWCKKAGPTMTGAAEFLRIAERLLLEVGISYDECSLYKADEEYRATKDMEIKSMCDGVNHILRDIRRILGEMGEHDSESVTRRAMDLVGFEMYFGEQIFSGVIELEKAKSLRRSARIANNIRSAIRL